MTTPADLMRDRAACADADAEMFFPVGHDIYAETAIAIAKDYCRRCPLIRACLTYALSNDVDGIWGGTTPAERVNLRRRHHIVAEQLDHDAYVRQAPLMEEVS